jgi:predicted N-acetyltransferase YhbS
VKAVTVVVAQLPDGRPIEIRAAEPSDRAAVLALLGASLGVSVDDRYHAFFDWKHEQNPFGRSPAWVAVDGGEVVGFRTFMRWEHRAPTGEVLPAVRAVDTATHPTHQGRGIFRRLTLQALDDLGAQGVAFVFNTPNDQSRPGYLKMGWRQVGRLAATVRPRSLASAARLTRARVPADLLSVPAHGGRPAPAVLADPALVDLLASAPPATGLATHRTPGYLRWRYGFAPLAYRAVSLGDDLRSGLAIFRLRRRGPALECALCDVVAPVGERRAPQALVRRVAQESGADYVIRIGGPAIDRRGFVRLPGHGPVLTWYALADDPPGGRLGDWALTLGDVELF